MEAVFEKIKERLRNIDPQEMMSEEQRNVLNYCIEIVNQVEAEYKTECNSSRLEPFEKIDAILQKYRKKWLEQPNTEPCKGLECISNDCVDCMLTHLENDINQVAEEYNQSLANNNQSLTNGGWIPCSRELPSDGEIHECTALFNTGMRYIEYAYYDVAREEWWTHDDTGLVNVIAWKSSPQPYRGE